MLAEKLGHDLKPRFGIEVSPDLPMQPDRGARIDKVGDLHDMLALARWISGNRARIFEIELDLLPWLPARERLGLAATVLLDAASAAQDLPNRRLGAGQADAGVFEGRITMDIVEDRFWPGDTLQVLRRSCTDLQDTLDDRRRPRDRSWRCVTCARAGMQRHDIVRIGLVQSLKPFTHPGA
jgi:hypothetical protein